MLRLRSFSAALTVCLAGCVPAATTSEGEAVSGAPSSLPLKPGFYVASDTACGEASNATLLLVRKDGVGGSREFCAFKSIERTGATSYSVTQSCWFIGGDGSEEEAGAVIYDIQDDASFSMTGGDGWKRSARYCDQTSLPEPWRDNDISDVTG